MKISKPSLFELLLVAVVAVDIAVFKVVDGISAKVSCTTPSIDMSPLYLIVLASIVLMFSAVIAALKGSRKLDKVVAIIALLAHCPIYAWMWMEATFYMCW